MESEAGQRAFRNLVGSALSDRGQTTSLQGGANWPRSTVGLLHQRAYDELGPAQTVEDQRSRDRLCAADVTYVRAQSL